MQKLNSFIRIGLLIAFALAFFASVASRNENPDNSRHAKARYYFVEGSVALAEGRTSDAYELIKKAAITDPDYSEAAYNYGLMRLTLRNDTLQSPTEVARSIALMRPFVDEYPEEAGEAMNYSFIVARSGNLDEAIRVAQRTDSLAPELSGTLLQLAQYYNIKQDYDHAIKCLDRYARIEGNNPELSLRKLALFLSKGDTTTLLNESLRLVNENPVNPDYMIIRGNVFEALEMPDSAFAAYQRAEAMDPDDGRTKLTLANFYLEMGDSASYDLKSSEALLSENILLEEKLDMLARYMQNILADSADTSRGTRLFEGLLRQYPHEPQVLALGAEYFAAIGNLNRAEELISYATDLEPDNQDNWTRLATYYFSDEKYAESVATCEKAMEKLKETPSSLLIVYGASTQINGDFDKARISYQRRLDIDLPGALLTDSVSSVLKKAAILDYDALIRVAGIYAIAGDCSWMQGDRQRAMQEYEVCVALDPTNIMSLNNLAYYLAVSGGDLDRALQLSCKTIEAQPENPTYLDTYAWILYLKGQYQEALEIQEKIIDSLSGSDEIIGEYWEHLGDMQYKVGLKDKALDSWKNAKNAGGDNPQLLEKIRTKKLNE